MCDATELRPRSGPPGFEVSEIVVPDVSLNRRFYESVGAAWNWTDRLAWSDREWRRWVEREQLRTWIGSLRGDAVGYFELEEQDDGNVELAYFGLLPDFIGQGLGGPLLSAAVEQAWQMAGVRRVWVHTCTDDHQHALSNYRNRGFRVFRTEHTAE